MFCLSYKIRNGSKGQLASVLTVILVIFLIVAFVSVNLGKLSLNRTRLSNAVDSASLAAASSASQLLNYMASYNEMMLLNFSGFVTQVMLLIVQYMLDVATIVYLVTTTFAVHVEGVAPVVVTGAMVTFALMSLELTMLTIILLIEGATKVGESLETRINELNVKLPETTRNIARQYAFMNAGIDEPRIDYDDWLEVTGNPDNNNSWIEYLDSDEYETGFAEFMRTFSETNDENHARYDSDFGPNNMISFAWNDQRTGQIVDNTVEVYTTPMQALSFDTKDFGDISSDSGLRDEMSTAISNAELSGFYDSWINLGITMSPTINTFLTLIIQLINMAAALVLIYFVVSGTLEAAYTALCATYTACSLVPPPPTAAACLLAATYYCTILVPGIGGFLGFESVWVALMTTIAATTLAIDPSGIPCFVYGNDGNDVSLSAEIKRWTRKADGTELDYGLWNMRYPEVGAYSKAEAVGTAGPKLFPPVQEYNAEIIETR